MLFFMDNKEIKLKGNLALVGFEVLEPEELEIMSKIAQVHLKKIEEIGNCQEMRINLNQHQKGKTFKHEIKALAVINNQRFSADVTEWNVYSAMAQVFEKIFNEAAHKLKKGQRHDKIVSK